MEIVYLCFFAFLAGLVDSIVGGGGLIQLPAMFLFLPGDLAKDIPTIWGTNKFAATCGTVTAAIRYARRVTIPWNSILPAGVVAFVFSFLGARTVTAIDTAILKPIILVLLVVVAVYIYSRKDFGNLHAPKLAAHRERLWGMLVGLGLGFYDGFFGPGTGSFLIFIFIGWFGFDFLVASASAKFINAATNLSSILYFAATDHIVYHLAVPMGVANMLGSLLGTRLAVLKGNRFIRIFFLLVVSAMILRFGWELLVK